MKNTFGNILTLTLFGESHGEAIGGVLDGMSPGVKIDEEYIAQKLSLRRPSGKISTQRVEKDSFKILSGVFEGYTTGTPIAIVIENSNVRSSDYGALKTTARPGHADYTGFIKYHGFNDHRGGGHFSGRITAAAVALGAIAQYALETKGIIVGTHIKKCADVCDREFGDLKADIKKLSSLSYAVLDEEAGELMKKAVEEAASEGDSVGGVLETAVTGLPAGLGEPFFDSVESLLSHAMFSIPAVKGIEFGDGFALCDMKGSQANDPFYAENGEIKTLSNRAGGINGGITNGMPVVFRTAVKPTPSIFKTQKTVDFDKRENTELSLSGRHDPAIVHRARAVEDALTSLVLCDLLLSKFGADYFTGEKK